MPLAGSPLALRPELLYAQRGVKFSGTDNTPEGSTTFDAGHQLGLPRGARAAAARHPELGFVRGGQSVGVGIRYTHGFTNLTKDTDTKNRTLSVYGSIEFPFGR